MLYPDNSLQHTGIFPLCLDRWQHVYRGAAHDHPGVAGELAYAPAVPAVTGACLMIRRKLFAEVGGFDEQLPVTFNDVELCCRIRARGLKVAITPHARLWHFEALSRGYSRATPFRTAH